MDVLFRSRFLSLILPLMVLLSGCADGGQTFLPDEEGEEPTIVSDEGKHPSIPTQKPETNPVLQAEILKNYDHLDPERLVPDQALREAVLFFHANKSIFRNQKVISVIDYGMSSKKKRFFVIDLKSGNVWALHVAHGKGSDSNHDGFAEKFSNVSGSNASSLGFFRTGETYDGKYKYSLRLDGLSSTNSQARVRAIVVHGASYVQDKEVVQGRSLGCPAVSFANSTKLVDIIKEGSLIYSVGGQATQKSLLADSTQ